MLPSPSFFFPFELRYAEKTGGECVLRFDDTNPEAEKIEYFEEIEGKERGWRCAERVCRGANSKVTGCARGTAQGRANLTPFLSLARCLDPDTVKWMGFTPSRVTCSSDYYQDMFDFAVQLIREDKAYVCHQTGEEISESVLSCFHE